MSGCKESEKWHAGEWDERENLSVHSLVQWWREGVTRKCDAQYFTVAFKNFQSLPLFLIILYRVPFTLQYFLLWYLTILSLKAMVLLKEKYIFLMFPEMLISTSETPNQLQYSSLQNMMAHMRRHCANVLPLQEKTVIAFYFFLLVVQMLQVAGDLLICFSLKNAVQSLDNYFGPILLLFDEIKILEIVFKGVCNG